MQQVVSKSEAGTRRSGMNLNFSILASFVFESILFTPPERFQSEEAKIGHFAISKIITPTM